jgi:uroporphyrinogen-III synthase
MWAAAAGEAAFDDAVRAAVASGVRVAATGERTADTLRSVGFADVLVPEYSSAEGLVAALSATTGTRALFPRGNIALSTLPAGLRALDWTVDEAVVYDTNAVEATPASTVLLGEGVIGAVIVRSPSAVKALASHASLAVDVHLVCSGETTAAAARAAGLTVAAVAPSPTPADMASTVARLVTGA